VKFIKAIATVGVIIAMLLSAVIAKDYYKQYPKQTLIVTLPIFLVIFYFQRRTSKKEEYNRKIKEQNDLQKSLSELKD
jgi:uncharacterized protein YacL